MRIRRRITSGGGDPRESATESKPPDASRKAHADGKGERVRQERTALAATSAARQAPPGARPNRSDALRFRAERGLIRWPGRSGWLLEAPGDGRPRGMAVTPGLKTPAIQNPAYRPAGVCFASGSN